MNPRRKSPNLKYIPRTEEELTRLSEITPQDIADAKAFVERAAPLMAKLLDAKLYEGNSDASNPG